MFLCRPNTAVALPVSGFGGLVRKLVNSLTSCSVTLAFNTDGTITCIEGGPAGTFTNGASGDVWFKPTTPGAGSKYWIQFTIVSGVGPSSGSTTLPANPLQLTANRTVTYTSPGGGGSRTGALNFTISETSGGPAVCSGTYTFDVESSLV